MRCIIFTYSVMATILAFCFPLPYYAPAVFCILTGPWLIAGVYSRRMPYWQKVCRLDLIAAVYLFFVIIMPGRLEGTVVGAELQKSDYDYVYPVMFFLELGIVMLEESTRYCCRGKERMKI